MVHRGSAACALVITEPKDCRNQQQKVSANAVRVQTNIPAFSACGFASNSFVSSFAHQSFAMIQILPASAQVDQEFRRCVKRCKHKYKPERREKAQRNFFRKDKHSRAGYNRYTICLRHRPLQRPGKANRPWLTISTLRRAIAPEPQFIKREFRAAFRTTRAGNLRDPAQVVLALRARRFYLPGQFVVLNIGRFCIHHFAMQLYRADVSCGRS